MSAQKHKERSTHLSFFGSKKTPKKITTWSKKFFYYKKQVLFKLVYINLASGNYKNWVVERRASL